MRSRFLSVWSVLIVLVISLAVLMPGCESVEETGTIRIEATLCGAPWEGVVNYTLMGSGETGDTRYDGNSVGYDFTGHAGGWTCADVFGGPAEAHFIAITPSATQELSAGGTIIFTLDFKTAPDADIDPDFCDWTIDGVRIEDWEGGWRTYLDGVWWVEISEWGHTIGGYSRQHIGGCEGETATLNETAELEIHWKSVSGEPAWPVVHVTGNWSAVHRPTWSLDDKTSQALFRDGSPVDKCLFFDWPEPGVCANVTLSVETTWALEEGMYGEEFINWLHIGPLGPESPPDGALFELRLEPLPGSTYVFEMASCTSVGLADKVDIDPDNDHACNHNALLLWFTTPSTP